MKEVRPYGSWPSVIGSELLATKNKELLEISLEGDQIYWLEQRPDEKGRNVIMRQSSHQPAEELLPTPWNSCSHVHEYGGASYLVDQGTIYFVGDDDQRYYRLRVGEKPEPITPEEEVRYACGVIDRQRQRLICIREDHRYSGEPRNEIVAIDLQTGQVQVLVQGNDFYSSPCLSPDGRYLAWLTWNHPHMPWTESECWLAEIHVDGSLRHHRRIAGGKEEAVAEPKFSPDGRLYFLSDRSNWWNLYCYHDHQVTAIRPQPFEIGTQQFFFGHSSYAFLSAEKLICTYTRQGEWYLAFCDLVTGAWQEIETPYTYICYLQSNEHAAVFVGGSPTFPLSVIKLDYATMQTEVLRRSLNVPVHKDELSIPQTISFPTSEQQKAYGFYYPPTHRQIQGPTDERPPLIVTLHGGPTAAAHNAYRLDLQYWTNRGFAVLDVNYRGSTGYGRDYRLSLDGNWGVWEVDDCVYGTRFLAEQGLIDEQRTIIRGRSAGGFTTLAALTFRDTFQAGASYFGVSDLRALRQETHKFESRYLDRLLADFTQRPDLYQERSPLNHREQLNCPVIFFQGGRDHIVPPNQAKQMVEALDQRGIPVAYVFYPTEGHGFKQKENIQHSLESELSFYAQVFGFSPAEKLPTLPIRNIE
jgi:dipeptidyl aminopeptidase/acylaminoacyl peptidase